MTLVYEAAGAGPRVHALVIGVGAYPFAKPAHQRADTPRPLRDVADLESAATGAALFADWLISEARCDLPLGSVEVLKSGPGLAGGEYGWSGRIAPAHAGADPRGGAAAVEAPTMEAMRAAGIRWLTRLRSEQGTVGIVYVCGHGGVLSSRPIVFLSDLNEDEASEWGAFLDLGDLAAGLKHLSEVAAAHIFVDACAEIIREMGFENHGNGAKFLKTKAFGKGVEKVSLLGASAPNYLAYEDTPTTGGRFTILLLEALRGASARNPSGMAEWVVQPHDVHADLKRRYATVGWAEPFEPAPPLVPSEPTVIVRFTDPPTIFRRVALSPEAALGVCDLEVLDPQQRTPPLHRYVQDGGRDWRFWMKASIYPHYLKVDFPGGHYASKLIPFTPIQSVFDQVLAVN